MSDSKIVFTDENNETVEFEVIEEAKIAGVNYLLVTESIDDEDSEDAYILKEFKDENGEVTYDMLDDENELKIISDYFNSLMDDVDLEV